MACSTICHCCFASDRIRAGILLLLFNSNFSPFMVIKCQLPRTRDGKELYGVPGMGGGGRVGWGGCLKIKGWVIYIFNISDLEPEALIQLSRESN